MLGIAVLLLVESAQSHEVTVKVLDQDGAGVPGVVVYAYQDGAGAGLRDVTAVMDQRDTRFVPHILVVQKGTAVEFPNSDVVAHHVYSFSKPNNFVLPLYKGDPHAPIVFNHDGIVTLGCNIHDDMLAYIVVVDTTAFGTTDASGTATLRLTEPDRDAVVHIWSPRIRDKDLAAPLAAHGAAVEFRLEKKLRPPYHSDTDAIEWTDY